MRQPKIVIVGAGLVGGSAALFTALAIPSAEIVVIDLARIRAEGQVLDLAHAAAFWGHNRFHAGEYEDARDADVIVITAGVGVKPGQTRLDLAKTNAEVALEIVDGWLVSHPMQFTSLPPTPATCLPLSYLTASVARASVSSVLAPRSIRGDCARCSPSAWASSHPRFMRTSSANTASPP
nr:hypothetical protein [Cupriavidus sp. WGlv3]